MKICWCEAFFTSLDLVITLHLPIFYRLKQLYCDCDFLRISSYEFDGYIFVIVSFTFYTIKSESFSKSKKEKRLEKETNYFNGQLDGQRWKLSTGHYRINVIPRGCIDGTISRENVKRFDRVSFWKALQTGSFMPNGHGSSGLEDSAF